MSQNPLPSEPDFHTTDGRAKRLEARVLAAIARGNDTPVPDFEALAIEVFRFQFAHNRAYRQFCLYKNTTPETLDPSAGWDQIPAVPTDVFKVANLTTFPVDRAVRTFQTSGTTQGTRGKHHFVTLALYQAAIVPPFMAFMLPDRARLPILSLISPPDVAPDSSLSFMTGYLASRQDVCNGQATFFMGRAGLETARFVQALQDAAMSSQPVMILTTALALKHFFDQNPSFRIEMPSGSRMLQTGGVKGLRTAWLHQQLLEQTEKVLGIPPSHCIAEYGMTELSSQMYETTLRDRHIDAPMKPLMTAFDESTPAVGRPLAAPPWLKWLVVDPISEAPLPPGQAGLVRFFDLANLYSVSAIQTSDIAVQTGDHLLLLGRDTQATPRGCSLRVEEQVEGRMYQRGT